jgi:hypothetical protein
MAVAIIPAVLFVYAQSSRLIQLIFNPNFDENALKHKWQLNSYASYTLITIGLVNFVNMVLIKNINLETFINISLMVSLLWYFGMIIKHHFFKKPS